MGNVTAVLMDTVTIQNYVFGGNKLKENIGASANVSGIYQDYLQSSVKAVVGPYVSFKAWQKEPEAVRIIGPEVAFEVGYIGGGKGAV